MRYLSQIVQDARPRRAAEPLSAVGVAPYPTGIAPVDPSAPPAQPLFPQPDDTVPDAPRRTGTAQPLSNADARAVRSPEVETGIAPARVKADEDMLPTARSRPVDTSDVAAAEAARAGKLAGEPMALSQVSGRFVQQGVEAQQSDTQRVSEAPHHRQYAHRQRQEKAPADPVRAGLGSGLGAVDGNVQAAEGGPQGSDVDRTGFDAPPPPTPFEEVDRAAFGNAEDNPFDPRALSIAADERADKPVTEVRIGHIDIIVEDTPLARPVKTAPQRAQPSPARYHVRRL